MSVPSDPPAVRALVAVARLVLIEVERAGMMRDDRPEIALSEVERWCDGKASLPDVMGALDQVASATWEHGEGNEAAAIVMWVCRVNSRQREVERTVLRKSIELLVRLGEARDAAEHRIQSVFAQRRAV